MTRRSRVRRAGESVFGLLLVVKTGVMVLLAVLLLVAGVWTSWDTAQHAMFPEGRTGGTLTLASCGDEVCRGRLGPHQDVTIGTAVAGKGDSFEVVLRPGTHEAVRTGAAGILYAWVPLAGALLLGSLVVAGGLRLWRTAWVMGLLGAGVMVAAFALL